MRDLQNKETITDEQKKKLKDTKAKIWIFIACLLAYFLYGNFMWSFASIDTLETKYNSTVTEIDVLKNQEAEINNLNKLITFANWYKDNMSKCRLLDKCATVTTWVVDLLDNAKMYKIIGEKIMRDCLESVWTWACYLLTSSSLFVMFISSVVSSVYHEYSVLVVDS